MCCSKSRPSSSAPATVRRRIWRTSNGRWRCEAKFYTERVSKDFAYHQALARGAHNPVIASMLLVITPDVLRYYQRYRVCTVPQEEVYFEHRELLRCVREKDEEGAVAMQRRHLKSLSEFAAAFNDENHFLE